MEECVNSRILELKDEVIRLRRDFHMHPELGFQEHRTSGIVKAYLETCGIKTQGMAQTGVVGLLRGAKPGPTVMLRADMDALPVTEANDVPYKSQNEGKMHACGHDGHTAMLLVAAKVLSEQKDSLCGNVKFCFQPNEEDAGAEKMIQDGVLENPSVDVCVGCHLWVPLPCGKIGLSGGAVMAGMDHFWITVHGKGGHSGSPHEAVDPITAACAIIENISFIEKRQIGTLNPTIITVNTIHGGTATNIISDEVELSGTIRYLYNAGDHKPRQHLEQLVKHICDVYGTTYSIRFALSSSPLLNDEKVVNHLRPETEELVGAENVVPCVTMGGEDFAEFVKLVPGAFAFIGAGNAAKGIIYPHHHPKFNVDEDALLTGIEFYVQSVLSYLK